jgi:hypothetical protein
LVPHDFPHEQISGYRILENWLYDPLSGVTTIDISGVAPVLDVYGDAGDYRGTHALFWVKWKDLLPGLVGYKKHQSQIGLDNLIWAEYFKDSAMCEDSATAPDTEGEGFRRTALRTIQLLEEDYSDNQRNLAEREPLQSLGEQLFRRVLSLSAGAYRNPSLNEGDTMPASELLAITAPRRDTVEVSDCWGEGPRRIRITDFPFSSIRKYSVKEKWTFDMSKGVSQIRYLAIAPLLDKYADNSNYTGTTLLFWCAYDSVAQLLRNYREYYHENNIEWKLWNSRFLELKQPRN